MGAGFCLAALRALPSGREALAPRPGSFSFCGRGADVFHSARASIQRVRFAGGPDQG
jgi:hypothetical protein